MTRRSKTMKERTYYSTRGRTTFQRTMNYDERFYDHIMTMKQQDILGNYKHSIQCKNTTGGQGCEHSSRNMSRDVELANNIKLTETHQNQHSNQWRQPNPHVPFPIAPWIKSWTCHQSMDTILSWSW